MGGVADIIGFSCRFPESGSPSHFWKNLIDGVDMVSSVPKASSDPSCVPDFLLRLCKRQNSIFEEFVYLHHDSIIFSLY